MQNLFAPTLPKYMSLAEVIAALGKYFAIDSKPAVIAEKLKFHKRGQLPGEYLCHQTTHCALGAYFNDALQGCLDCGLCSERTQRGCKLLNI